MPVLERRKVENYLSQLYGLPIKLISIGELSKEKKEEEELKEYGYGSPILIEFKIGEELKRLVLETMLPSTFGHDHFADRAEICLWSHATFNNLPRHVRSLDVGAFASNSFLLSLGQAVEFFLITDYVVGREYYHDLWRIREKGKAEELDYQRVRVLSDYLVEIHRLKGGTLASIREGFAI